MTLWTRQLVLFTLVTCFTNRVFGLQCYECTYNKITTGNSFADAILKLVTSKVTSDEECRLQNDDDLHKVVARTCKPAADGTEKRCVVVKGQITFSVLTIDVKYETLSRDCVDVEKGSERASANNECFTEDKTSSTMSTIITDYFDDLDVSGFTGEGCYYQNDLGSEKEPQGILGPGLTGSLQCFACSDNVIRTGQDVLDKIANWVAKIASDKFCEMAEDDDKYKISSKTCPSPSSQDKISRCVALKGDITFVLAGIDVVYETFTRDCVEVDVTSEKAAQNDKCYPEQTQASTFQRIVDDYFEGLQISDFTGEGCYYQNSWATETMPEGLTAGQAVLSATVYLILLVIITLWFI